jgi:hypothetical protein
MILIDGNICLFLGGGQSLGARTALRRNDSFEDLKETIITINIITRDTLKDKQWTGECSNEGSKNTCR